MEDILQESETEIRLATIKNHIAWWEKKRWIYNVILFIVGFLPFLFFNRIDAFFSPILIVILFYALIANLCYCAGWGAGFLLWHYTKRLEFLTRANWFFFISGIVLSVLITFILAILAVETL